MLFRSLGLYWPRMSKQAAASGLIVGSVVMVTLHLSGHDPLLGEIFGDGFADRVLYYPTTTREQGPRMGRITDNLVSGKVFADLGLPPMNPAEDRAMVCGSLAFNIDVKAVLEEFGLREGANSEPREFVVEKAFVGDGI